MVTEVTNLGPLTLIYLNYAYGYFRSFITISSTADEATSKRLHRIAPSAILFCEFAIL